MRLPPLINDVATGRTPAYPDIQPLDLPLAPDAAFDRCAALARRMPGWRSVRADRGTGRIEAEAVSRLFRFVDDVTIAVAPHGAGSRIDMRSRSRVGRGDFGANARRIRAFFAALQPA
jgi:uncharacterized protein (DUF1499 family)